MRTLRTLLLASLLIIGSLLVVSATDPPHGPDDSFMCFKTRVAPGTPQFIEPDPLTVIGGFFQLDNTEIRKPNSLCVPVQRDGRPPVDSTTSLVGYPLVVPGVKQSIIPNVPVLDSFGPRWVDLVKFELYSAPSLTNPPSPPSTPPYSTDNVDRFACAKAKQNRGSGPFPKTLTATITDELTHQTRVMRLKKPSRLCLPVNARGEGMKNPRGALMCYQARPAAKQPKHLKQSRVQIFNEFPSVKLDTTLDTELCVPAQASVGPIAVLQAAPTTGIAPLSVAFSGLGSIAPLGKSIQFEWNLGGGVTSSASSFTHTFSVPGIYHVTMEADAGTGFLGLDEVTIEVAAAATPSPSPTPTVTPTPTPSVAPTPSPTPVNLPPQAAFQISPTGGSAPIQLTFDGSSSTDPDGSIVSFSWDFGDGGVASQQVTTHTFASGGPFTITLTVVDNGGATNTQRRTIELAGPPPVPPDPAQIAPVVDQSVPTFPGMADAFLYTGQDRVQVGVAPGTIEPRRAATIRGRLTDGNGNGLPGVLVTVLQHPEFGATATRSSGLFDMVVNGGGSLVVDFRKPGFLRAQRSISVTWADGVVLDDVVMLEPDPITKAITFGPTAPPQFIRASEKSDNDGTRQATVLFPAGTTALLEFADGTTQDAGTLHLRATEFTFGINGLKAMPADLPPTSAYTYAVEFTADEAPDASHIRFNHPVSFYVENFVGIPVGIDVPVGSYERSLGKWIPEDDGRVLKIISTTGGTAQLDSNGDNEADDESVLLSLGIDEAERVQLASLYLPGKVLWRVPLSHFTTPVDLNFPFAPPEGAGPSDGPPPTDPTPPDPAKQCGSIVNCENRSLAEEVPIIGTPLSLHYESERTAGHTIDRRFTIQLTGPAVHPELRRVEFEVVVAGQKFAEEFSAAPNQVHEFREWDGTDAYGRTLQGPRDATVRVGYVFPARYGAPPDGQRTFGAMSRAAAVFSPARLEVTLWRQYSVSLGSWDARGVGLGGFTLDNHHTYDLLNHTVLYGDGRRHAAEDVSKVVRSIAGNGQSTGGGVQDGVQALNQELPTPFNLASAPSGTYFVSVYGPPSQVVRVDPDGAVHLVAGQSQFRGFSGDGGPATSARFGSLLGGLALDPEGNLYIVDTANHRIRRVNTSGIIETVAGSGCASPCLGAFSGDDQPATSARLDGPQGIAIAPDGSLVIADTNNHRIRRVALDGTITTIAGDGINDTTGDGGPAGQARISTPRPLVVDKVGNIYFGSGWNVRRIAPNGTIDTVAGLPMYCGVGGDGGPAVDACLGFVIGLDVAADGSLLIAVDGGLDNNLVQQYSIREVSPGGIIRTLAGGPQGFSPDLTAASETRLRLPGALELLPDGGVLVADTANNRVRVFEATLPPLGGSQITVPSDDGRELLVFDGTGRHLRTIDALTGVIVWSFGYDAGGRLVQVQDRNGHATVVERDAFGKLAAFVAPGGQRTPVTLDAQGYLQSIKDPSTAERTFEYASGGLLTRSIDANLDAHVFGYDTVGRLTTDSDPAGGMRTLGQVDDVLSRTVTVTSALDRLWTYAVERFTDGTYRRVISDSAGLEKTVDVDAGGSRHALLPDGTEVSLTKAPHPRQGMASPIIGNAWIKTPGNVQATVREFVVAEPSDLSRPIETYERSIEVNNQAFTSTYDRLTRTLTASTPELRLSQIVLDVEGRILEVGAGGTYPVRFEYDAVNGQPSAVRQGVPGVDERITAIGYEPGAFNRIDRVTNGLLEEVGFTYDSAERVSVMTRPDSSTLGFDYDGAGNLIELTTPTAAAHGFDYSPIGLLTDYVPPAITPPVVAAYNVDRQLTTVTRADGSIIEYDYDPTSGRLASITTPDGDVSLQYDPTHGQLTGISTPSGDVLTLSWDGFLPIGQQWSGAVSGSVAQTFDGNFQVATEAVNGVGSVSFQYDRDGLLRVAGAEDVTRDEASGRVTATTLGIVEDAKTYNGFGETASYQVSVNGTDIYSVVYDDGGTQGSRDALGRIVKKRETINGVGTTWEYEYDALRRLHEVRRNGTFFSAYIYDANGNRDSYQSLTSTIGPAETDYDSQDRLTTYGATTYQYGPGGEVLTETTAAGQTTYDYDASGNLVSVVLPSGLQVSYIVDGRNRRIGRVTKAPAGQPIFRTGYLYSDQIRIVAEVDSGGSVVSRFVYGEKSNVPDYMIKGGATYRIISDERGSPVLVVDAASGIVAQKRSYDEFGNVVTDTNPGFQPFGFAGGMHDEDTKLVRFGARDYMPKIGRWASKDPILFQGGDPDLYSYVLNDPVNLTDPEGKTPLIVVPLITGAISATGAGLGAYLSNASGSEIAAAAAFGFVPGFFAGFGGVGTGLGPMLGLAGGTGAAAFGGGGACEILLGGALGGVGGYLGSLAAANSAIDGIVTTGLGATVGNALGLLCPPRKPKKCHAGG